MASRRMISTTLGGSEKFQALANDTHRLAYVLLITYADSEGRLEADAVILRGKLYTRLPWSDDTVEAALLDMYDVGLIRLYMCKGKRYAYIEDFHTHNTIRRKEDGTPKEEAPSRLPEPPESVEGDTESNPVPVAYRKRTGTAPAKENVKGREREVEGNARASETDEANSSEARHAEYLATGRSESQTAFPARAFFRRLIGTQNANHPQARDELTRWYTDHGEAAIRDLWARAKDNPENKPRLFWFIDALNGLKGTATVRPGATALTAEEERAFWGTN